MPLPVPLPLPLPPQAYKRSNSGLTYMLFSLVGLFYSPLFFSVHLLRIVNKNVLLQNVMQSVTLNAPSLLLTALLCTIVVYLFSIIGYVLFPEDFVSEDGDKLCDSIWQCFLFSFTHGVRSGGGLGDLLVQRHWDSERYMMRVVYDFMFYVVVTVCLLNIVFGIIIGMPLGTGSRAFNWLGGGEGGNRAPQNLGRGSGKRAQLTGPSISYYELWRRRRRKIF